MRFIPHSVTGERPGSPYSDEEISFCFSQQIANEDEQQANKGQHGRTHPEILISKTPNNRQPMHIEEKYDHQDDEQVERPAELRDIRFERVNGWDNHEQAEHSQRDQRHHEHAPEPGHGSIHLVVLIPVRSHLIWQLIPQRKTYENGGNDQNKYDGNSEFGGHSFTSRVRST